MPRCRGLGWVMYRCEAGAQGLATGWRGEKGFCRAGTIAISRRNQLGNSRLQRRDRETQQHHDCVNRGFAARCGQKTGRRKMGRVG